MSDTPTMEQELLEVARKWGERGVYIEDVRVEWVIGTRMSANGDRRYVLDLEVKASYDVNRHSG